MFNYYFRKWRLGNRLEKDLQDPEFAYHFGCDQAKMQLAFSFVDVREQLNLTQREVADKWKVSQPYVAKLEKGDANPTIGKVGGMLGVLGFRLTPMTEPILSEPPPQNQWQTDKGGIHMEGAVEYHKWLKDETIKVKLMKMSKGYQWEISTEEPTVEAAIDKIKKTNYMLRALYEEVKDE